MDWFEEYAHIAGALVIGAFAHFGRLLQSGQMPGFWQSIGFLMQLGLIGLASVAVVTQLGIENKEMQMLVTAILAVSAQEVVEFFKNNGWRGYTRAVVLPADERDDRD